MGITEPFSSIARVHGKRRRHDVVPQTIIKAAGGWCRSSLYRWELCNTNLFAHGGIDIEQRSRRVTTTPNVCPLQVDELIQGLEELGCLRTKGEDQTICVVSDSFNAQGFADDLQGVGDLPPVDVVKVMFSRRTFVHSGSSGTTPSVIPRARCAVISGF